MLSRLNLFKNNFAKNSLLSYKNKSFNYFKFAKFSDKSSQPTVNKKYKNKIINYLDLS